MRRAVAVRAMAVADIPAALAIQSTAYPAVLREDAAAFASRLAIRSCFCLAAGRAGAARGGPIVGYLLAHGWTRGSPPPVGAILPPTAPAEVLFVHDLAVSVDARGSGAGRALIARAFAAARAGGLPSAELIAVEGAGDYWCSLGFQAPAVPPALALKVAAYGPGARWMTRPLSRPFAAAP